MEHSLYLKSSFIAFVDQNVVNFAYQEQKSHRADHKAAIANAGGTNIYVCF